MRRRRDPQTRMLAFVDLEEEVHLVASCQRNRWLNIWVERSWWSSFDCLRKSLKDACGLFTEFGMVLALRYSLSMLTVSCCFRMTASMSSRSLRIAWARARSPHPNEIGPPSSY